ncbi:hypothetical protein [Klebsiella quasipneumoniae]
MTNVQADIQVDVGNNAWLLTLPEVRIEGELFEECTVVALRTLKDSWYHPDGENYSGPRTLAGRECQISLFWNGGGWGKEQTFVARYTSDLWDRTPELDLTGPDFILEKVIKGRGVGSWVMQQLICWARTLPAETPVKSIWISPNDEVNPENMTRRDSLWHGVGFRFREGGRQSLPLRVSDLQLPKGRHSPLTAVPVHKGVGELVCVRNEQNRELKRLKEIRLHQAERIKFLTERQWDVLLIKGVSAVILSPIWIPCWLFERLSGRNKHG